MNKRSFYQFFNVKPSTQIQSPPIEDYLATVLYARLSKTVNIDAADLT